jgi:hypothetical protein
MHSRTNILLQLCKMNHASYRLRISICILITLLQFQGFGVYAQQSTNADLASLRQREDSLKKLSYEIISGREASDRFRADSSFTRMFVRALKTPNSFRYPFDSLQAISRVYSPDSSFRIFTWQVIRDPSLHRRHGAIQMKTADGSLKLFPFIDRSHMINDLADTVANNDWWIGSIYYKIILKEFQGNKFYTLLGYDEHSMRSTMKRIEVLTFDINGNPVFGGPFFSFNEDSVRRATQARFWIEYKKDGNARMQFDEEMDLIIYDHLISESNEPNKKYTYIPDGDYEGFKWKNGQWVHIDKVFTFKLKDGEAPVINPQTEDKLGGKPKAAEPAKKKAKSGGN